MRKPIINQVASIHDRLLNHAKAQDRAYNDIFLYFLIERFLYRLSISPYSEQFVLKGAMAMILLDATFPRATRDIDFLGMAENSFGSLENAIKAICAINDEEDGLNFVPESVLSVPIKINERYPGIRFTFKVNFGKSMHSMQVDVGVSDRVFPAARKEKYPTLIGNKEFMIKTYAPEQMIAEKVQTLVHKGKLNSRMKDIFDIWWLAANNNINGFILAKSVKLVFDNRQTPIPEELSFFRSDYYNQQHKIAWQSLIAKMQTDENLPDLMETLSQLKPFLVPMMSSIYQGTEFNYSWEPEKEWAWQ